MAVGYIGYRAPEAAGTMRAIATDPCWLAMILGSGGRRVFDSLKEVCKQRRREGAITRRVATGYRSACLNQEIGGLAHPYCI